MYMYPKIAYFVLLSHFIFFVMCIWKLSNGWTDKSPSHIYRIVSWLSVDIIFICIIIPVWFLFCRWNCNRFVNELWRSCYPVFYMCYSLLCVILSFFVVHSFRDVSLSVLFYNDVHCTAYRPAIICGSCRMLFKFFGWSKRWAFFHVPGSTVCDIFVNLNRQNRFIFGGHIMTISSTFCDCCSCDGQNPFTWSWSVVRRTRPMNSMARFGLVLSVLQENQYGIFNFKFEPNP